MIDNDKPKMGGTMFKPETADGAIYAAQAGTLAARGIR